MGLRGRVKNGVVVLSNGSKLPEGAVVEVALVSKKQIKKAPATKVARKPRAARRKSLGERLASVIGIAKGLPPDMSVNHDHYLYGVPKRVP
jgi:hypothetical protein